MILKSVKHRAIGKSLKCLQRYLDNPHGWYWQQPWEELSKQQQLDIIEEFSRHDEYAACGVWKSEKHRANEEKRFLYDTTRKLKTLTGKEEGRKIIEPIGLAWLATTDLPAPVAMLVYVLNWSHGRRPAAVYSKLLNYLTRES
jgi:hypothetical protein